MAEGGDPDDRRNPFSFQNFLKTATEKVKKREDEIENGEHLLDPSCGIHRSGEKNRSRIIEEGHNLDTVEKGTRREENPFSFRQFLKKEQSPVKLFHGNNAPAQGETTKASACSSITKNQDCKVRGPQFATAPDFASGLPDFVQDHIVFGTAPYEVMNTPEQVGSSDTDSLPDFTLNSQSLPNTASKPNRCDDDMTCHPKKHLPKGTQDDLLFSLSGKTRNIRRSAIPQTDAAITSSLPDFLSDGPMFGNNFDDGDDAISNEASALTIYGIDSTQPNGSTVAEIAHLKAENKNVMEQLREIQRSLTAESQKVLDLSAEVDSLRKREAEETAALEKMVQQVESNLKITTQRAVLGENTILKLKQEVKALQSEISALKDENERLSNSDTRLPAVMKKTKSVSDQILVAALNAEQQLKQLLNGVETLKLTATYLADIDKMSEDFTSSKSNT